MSDVFDEEPTTVAKPGPVIHGKGSDDKYRPIAVDSAGRLVLGASGGAIDTELPSAAALADSASNPTTPTVGAASLVWGGSSWSRQIAVVTNADGLGGTASLNRPQVSSIGLAYNGATFDRLRTNTDNTIYASAARTADPTAVDQTNYNGRGLHVVIDVTAVTATPSVVFTIQGKNSLGVVYTILASAAITGTGTTVLKVYPGLTGAANAVANDVLPRTWNIKAVHADTDSITYSVTASVIL